MILSLIDSKNSIVVIASLQTLSKILRSAEMQNSWINFLELIVLKYIDNYKTSKEVSFVSTNFFFVLLQFYNFFSRFLLLLFIRFREILN